MTMERKLVRIERRGSDRGFPMLLVQWADGGASTFTLTGIVGDAATAVYELLKAEADRNAPPAAQEG